MLLTDLMQNNNLATFRALRNIRPIKELSYVNVYVKSHFEDYMVVWSMYVNARIMQPKNSPSRNTHPLAIQETYMLDTLYHNLTIRDD